MGQIADRVLKIVGEEAKANSCETLDMRVFDGTFHAVIEGDACFEIERCAAAVEAEQECGDYYADDDYEDRHV